MLFSVIIPTFNRAALLARTLESVFDQRFTDFEVIVVDDGSTDATEGTVQAARHPVLVVRQGHRGPGAARNTGARLASGEYLAFLDSDDLWFPWTLACFAALIQRYQNPSILSASLVEFVQETDLTAVAEMPLMATVFSDYLAASSTGYFVGAGMAILRRDRFFRAGGYTEREINAEDHDLTLRLGTAPGFVQINAPITLGWRRHGASLTRDVHQTFVGNRFLIAQESQGAYPGGRERAGARREVICRHTRGAALACLAAGRPTEAWQLYAGTFGWQLQLWRWKYLLGFPVRALLRQE